MIAATTAVYFQVTQTFILYDNWMLVILNRPMIALWTALWREHTRVREGLSFDTRLRCIRMMNFSILFCCCFHSYSWVGDFLWMLHCCCCGRRPEHLYLLCVELLLLAAIRKLQIMRKTSLFCSVFSSSSSKIPTMSMKICIIIILNYIFCVCSIITFLLYIENATQQPAKQEKLELSFSISKQSRILDYKLRTRSPQSKVSYTHSDGSESDEINEKTSHETRYLTEAVVKGFFCSLSFCAQRFWIVFKFKLSDHWTRIILSCSHINI